MTCPVWSPSPYNPDDPEEQAMTEPTPEQRASWRAEREAFDTAVAEAHAKAHGHLTPEERAMTPQEFCDHINARIQARNAQETDTAPQA